MLRLSHNNATQAHFLAYQNDVNTKKKANETGIDKWATHWNLTEIIGMTQSTKLIQLLLFDQINVMPEKLHKDLLNWQIGREK